MAEPQTNPPFQRVRSGQIREALDRLEGLVVDGLKHGFFDYSIACEVANGGKRQLVIRAGKSHKFTIPENEVPRYPSKVLRSSSLVKSDMGFTFHGCGAALRILDTAQLWRRPASLSCRNLLRGSACGARSSEHGPTVSAMY
jgi:hypothetical protein